MKFPMTRDGEHRSFVRRRAAVRRHRRSRRFRALVVDVLWVLLLLCAALFVVGGLVAGSRSV
ncbi:MAG TPA: hypothetical protein VOB72_00120 [Candidatus Dormibacteraeota bacterium]|nr:hypothetical protein [Candidatus Dormibacteraeota bacterium]